MAIRRRARVGRVVDLAPRVTGRPKPKVNRNGNGDLVIQFAISVPTAPAEEPEEKLRRKKPAVPVLNGEYADRTSRFFNAMGNGLRRILEAERAVFLHDHGRHSRHGTQKPRRKDRRRALSRGRLSSILAEIKARAEEEAR